MEGQKGQNYEQDCVEGVYVETDSTKKEMNGSKEKAKLTNKTPFKQTAHPLPAIANRAPTSRMLTSLALPYPSFRA